MDLPDLARSRAVLIGNGIYAEHPRIPNLPGAGACVQMMTELLTGPLCGWPAERITALIDVSAPHELARWVHAAVRDTEDVLLVYYVGHGMSTSEGQLALAVGETDPDPELLAHTATLYENLARILRGCRAPTKLVILDCCHAGLGARANYVFQSADLAEAYPVDGLYFIGASARDKKAKAPLDGELTYFTEAFLDVIRTGVPHLPPTLRLDQIFLELRARLVRANLPEPVEAGTRGAHQYPFARNAASAVPTTPTTVPRNPHHADAHGTPPVTALGSAHTHMIAPDNPHREVAGQGTSTSSGTTGTTRSVDSPTPEPDAATAHAEKPSGITAEPTARPGPDQKDQKEPNQPRRRLLVLALLFAAVALAALTPRLLRGQASPGAAPAPSRTPATGAPTTTAATEKVTAVLTATLADPVTDPQRVGAESLAFAPNGTTLAVGDENDNTYLWDTATGKLTATLPWPYAHQGIGVTLSAFAPDGDVLATSDDGGIYLWNTTSGRLTATLTKVNAPVAMAFTQGGTVLAIADDYDSMFYRWDTRTGDLTTTEHLTATGRFSSTNHYPWVYAVFAPNDTTLAGFGGDNDQNTYLWDTSTGKLTAALTPPCDYGNIYSCYVPAAAFTPDGTVLATADGGGSTYLWDTATGKLTATLESSSPDVGAMAFAPTGGTILAIADRIDSTTRLWDITTSRLVATLTDPCNKNICGASAVAFTPDGTTLAIGDKDGSTYLWRITRQKR